MTEYPFKFISGILSTDAIGSDGSVVINPYDAVCVKTCPEQGEIIQCMQKEGSNAECPRSGITTNNDLIESMCLPDWGEGKE